MEFWTSALISILLLLAAGALMASHVRAWRAARASQPEGRELDFRRRQFRRRMQTSTLLAILAAALFIGTLIPGPPLLLLIYWGGAGLMVCWVALLALADMAATKMHYDRVRDHYLTERAKLERELRRIEATRGNGRAAKTTAEDDEDEEQ